jgi:hypothetical protein
VKCLSCAKPMRKSVGDFDYTRLADLRGKIVTLSDVTTYECKDCGPSASYVEIPRIGALHRELAAAKPLIVKHLRCRFVDDAWTFVLELEPMKELPRRRARGAKRSA